MNSGESGKLEFFFLSFSFIQICRHCGGADWKVERGVKCISLSCSVFYERRKVQKELRDLSKSVADAGYFPQCMAELF